MMRIAIVGLLLLVSGCASGQKEPARPQPTAEFAMEGVDAIALRNRLVLFADNTHAEVAGVSSEIATRTKDRALQERTVRMKIRLIPLLYQIALQDDPREAFIDMWILVARFRQGVTVGNLGASFGEYQDVIADSALQLEAQFIEIGRQFFPDVMDESAEEIEAMAVRMPMGDVLDLQLYAVTSTEGTGGGVGSILRSPVTGLEGIGGTPAALDRITAVAANALQVLQNMPVIVRWHLELMMLQAQSTDTVVQTMDNLERLTQTAESLAVTADTLPETLRSEVETLLGGSNESIRALDATLVSAKGVTADIRATVDGANELMAGVQELTAATGEQEPSGDEVSRDIADYTKAAEEARALTAELRGLVDDLNDGKLDGVIAEVNNASSATIDQAAERAATLIDRLTWRLLIVVGVLLGGLVVYRLIASRLTPAAR
ncbi:MAG: hypothetical protein ACYTGD_02595 [Planctomycetota bacterium]|jgi:hypothetical protein